MRVPRPGVRNCKMSWHPQYRSSKFRHVYGKPASKENCYDSVPITRSVHDNHFCAVNPHFIAVVTECAGGGAFLVIPLHQTGKLDPHYPKVCGHRGNVLDIKWNPFNDFEIASCSEDATIKIWNIPKQLLTRNLTTYRKELIGHARRVGLVEWHPTTANILFSAVCLCPAHWVSAALARPGFLISLAHLTTGIMPKRGLDVSSCEIFRFYKLITTKSLIEPVSMIVPRRSESYQEDIYPPTAAAQPSLTAHEWLSGMNRGPIMMSLRPGSELLDSQTLPPERPLSNSMVQVSPQPLEPMKQPAEDGDQAPFSLLEEKLAKWTAEHHLGEKSCLTNGFDVFECSPPKTENELLQMFYRQQEEIRRLRELLIQREVQTKQLELEIKNLRMALGQL